MIDRLFRKFFPGDSIAVRGIIWNLASMVVVGCAGIIMNIIIAKYGTSDVLGVFNRVMAVYIILGQVASSGTQHSVIYYWSQAKELCDKKKVCTSLFCITLFSGACCSIIVAAVCFLYHYFFASASMMLLGVLRMAPALCLFGMNKFFLGFLNANRAMRSYSLLQIFRYGILIGVVILTIALHWDISRIFYAFLIAEFVVMIGAFFAIRFYWGMQKVTWQDIAEKWSFGIKAMLGGIVGETNTKIDILVLGIFCSDSVVGIYSFASLIAEGFYSLIFVFRSNLNPLFARFYADNGTFREMPLLKEVSMKMYKVCFALFGIIIVLFWGGCRLLNLDEYMQALLPMGILLGCLSLASPEIAKGNVLTLGGYPALDSKITLFATVCNLVFNFLMIPLCGIWGAALATGLSYLTYKMMIKHMHRIILGICNKDIDKSYSGNGSK